MDQTRSPHRRLTIVLATLLILALISVVPCITIDGKSYYLQLRSIVLEGDASYYNEMLYHYEGYAPDYYVVDSLPSGYMPNLFPLGFAVLLTPFFLLGHVGGLLLNAIGWGAPPVGYSFPEVLFTLMASAGLGSLGVLLSGTLAGRRYGAKAAFWATMGIWLASPLPAYIYAQPSFAHSLSVFMSVLVLLIWLHPNDNRVIRRGLALGLAVGLATLTRWQDGVFLILPAWDVLRYARKWKLWGTVRYIILIGIGMLVAVSPQLVLWKIQFGHWLTIPQGQGFMRWMDPQIIPVLFGAQHGLISWTPVMAIAFIAMIWMAIRKPSLGVPLLVLLVIQVYVNSVVLDWWAGWGFGGRRFLDMVPFFIVATTFLIKELPHLLRKAVPFVMGVLIIWNASLLYHYFSGHVSFGGKVFLGDWGTENWKLITNQPALAIAGAVVIIGILWVSSRRLNVQGNNIHSNSGYWMPPTWLIAIAMIYLVGWSTNLARTTIGTERLLVLNPEPQFRDWIIITEKPPFKGSGLKDIATKDTPWREFASWSVKPGGRWDLVTACEGNLSPGDTAAFVIAETMDGSRRQMPLRWERQTGPVDLPNRSWKQMTQNAIVARVDLPSEIKDIPYRTFAPLPLYLIRWAQFISDYSKRLIPLNAAYQCTLQLPDDFKPNRFEIRLQEAERCYIYGIGRRE